VHAKRLQLIRLSGDRVVLKRGVQEILLEGPGVGSVVEPVVKMLDGTATREQIVDAFPGELRSDVDRLLSSLLQRGMASESPDGLPEEEPGADALQAAFYRNFGRLGEVAPARLAASTVLVVGVNLISRALVRSLLELGVGEVRLAGEPVLDNHLIASEQPAERPGARGTLRRLARMPGVGDLDDVGLLCAASDFGPFDALLEVNRIALRAHRPFLPVWLADLVGHVGPLNHPFETACFRCYQVRAEANEPRWEVARAVREHLAENAEARAGVGLLPPMAALLGDVAALEIAKQLGGFAPSDATGRVLEINLVSFGSAVRRVLKIPRCPECGEVMRRGSLALTLEPQIPQE